MNRMAILTLAGERGACLPGGGLQRCGGLDPRRACSTCHRRRLECTSNFILPVARRARTSGRRRTCSGTGGSSSTDGCTTGSKPLGTPVTVRGATASRDACLQLVADDARPRRKGRERLPVQRLRARAARSRRRAERRSVTCRASAGPPASARSAGWSRSSPSAARSCAATSRCSARSRASWSARWATAGARRCSRSRPASRAISVQRPRLNVMRPGSSGAGTARWTSCARWRRATNGVGDLGRELSYMRASTELTGVQLVPGTRPFTGNLLGAILSG